MSDTHRMIDHENEFLAEEKMKDDDNPFEHNCQKNRMRSRSVDEERGVVQCDYCGKEWDVDTQLYRLVDDDDDTVRMLDN